jgi:hypothetical protein
MTHMTTEQAEAYRRPILDALGADDPVAVQEAEPELWRRLVEQAGAHLRTRPAEGEWSALECLGHMTDSELIATARYRWVLSESEPMLLGFDQNAWVARPDRLSDDPALLLEVLSVLRRANVALWRRVPAAERGRVGLHAERGQESYELLFRLQAGHGRIHRAQAERALAQARRPRPVG